MFHKAEFDSPGKSDEDTKCDHLSSLSSSFNDKGAQIFALSQSLLSQSQFISSYYLVISSSLSHLLFQDMLLLRVILLFKDITSLLRFSHYFKICNYLKLLSRYFKINFEGRCKTDNRFV